MAREEFFRDGFCSEFLCLPQEALSNTIQTWKDDVESFFTLLTLEIWGRLFFLGQSVDEVSERLSELSDGGTTSPPERKRVYGAKSAY
jgi:hypothetical protein